MSATPPRRWRKDGVKKLCGDLRLRHPHPRLDRAVVRGRRVQGRQADLVVGLAGDPQPAQAARQDVRACRPEDVRCIYLEGSGCYGRNGHEDAAADAALLAKAVGRPVRVQWSRADEHGWDPKGPPTLIDLRAAHGRRPATSRPGNRNSSFRSRPPAASWCRSIAATLAGMPAEDRHRARQHLPELEHPLQVRQHQRRSATGWRRRRSARPGSGRRGGCRTPTPTNASWTSWRRRRAPIRSSSA